MASVRKQPTLSSRLDQDVSANSGCMPSADLLWQVKHEMGQGSKRQLSLPQTEQEGADAEEAVLDTKVNMPNAWHGCAYMVCCKAVILDAGLLISGIMPDAVHPA